MRSLFDHTLLAQLHSSARSVVHRAVAHDGTALIVKKPNHPFPSFLQLAQFKREYAIARRCPHPGVVRALALQLHRGHWTMLHEDIGGTALDQVLRAHGPLAPVDVLDIALQLCAALEAVHAQGVIHKDINPANLVWNGAARVLQLIDFGIACELPHESVPTLEGTLRYMAPEQTGRMNRRVDYRADFYAIGATLYELLAGQAPFEAGDEMELVHCHIARCPDWSHPAFAQLPGQLLAIIQRLLEKDADRRYQSVQGLHADLAACRSAGTAPAQALRLSDQNGRFMVPQTLHGREEPVAALLAAFERSAAGACEMVLVAGPAGIGKSALVHEVQQPIAARRGRFLAGKFDQFQRDVPYASLIQACQQLVHQLLAEPGAVLRDWAARLHRALGHHLGVMVELIPQLGHIVGPTEPVPATTPALAQLRLDRVFPRFVQVFAAPAHPLVLFLDDLQWADAATLRMIAQCMAADAGACLLCIGAYRDHDVASCHPVVTLRDGLVDSGVPVTTLVLAALNAAQVGQMVAATVRVHAADCTPLAQLCWHKTGGNPFFLNQFLATVREAGHLRYRAHTDSWDWDIEAIEQAGYTDNVVTLLLDTIGKLPMATQRLLQLAASIGNRFTLDMLALAVGQAPWDTQEDLWPALDAGLVQPLDARYKYVDTGAGDTGVGYRFLHDRVQQAAYLVLDEHARAANHLLLGRLLRQHTPPAHEDGALFDIVEQLNAGRILITAADERLQLAALNLRAGARARRSAAFAAMLHHMRTGVDLLPDDAAQQHADLWRDLQTGSAEAAYLCGQFAVADAIYPLVRAHSPTPLLQVRCIAIQAHQYQLQGRLQDAIAVQRDGLAQLGIVVAQDAGQVKARCDALLLETMRLHGSAPPARWLAAGPMLDPVAVATMQMMQGLWMASYYAGQQDLSALMVVSMTRLSMDQGTSDFSAVAYVAFAMLRVLAGGEVAASHDFGAMALALARSRTDLQARTLTGLMFAALINHWTQPLRSSDALYDEAFGWALEIADFVQVGVVVAVRATERLILGDYLPDLLDATRRDLALMRANGQQAMADCCVAAAIVPMQCLLGHTPGEDSDGATFSTAAFLAQYGHSPLYRAYWLQGALRHAYLFDGADAEALAGEVDLVVRIMRGQAKVVEATFYAALTWLRALRRDPARADAVAVLARIDALQASLAGWAAHGSDHAGPKSLLVQAEMARHRHDLALATQRYQQALDAAGLAGYVNIQALGNELYGEYWLEQGQHRVATVFIEDAIARYGQWGAEGKVAQLRARHGTARVRSAGGAGRATPGHAGSHTCGNAALDMVSLLKAAQILSNEVGLRNVLTRLMAIVRENAGGQVARLLLLARGVCRLEADIDGDVITVLQARVLDLDAESDPQLPLSLLRYVIRTGAEVIEDSIGTSARFGTDPYVRQHRLRAVMCLPIRQGGRIGGVLYFENRLADASFTEERVAFLRMLGAQAMISIASARLHDSLEQRVAERTAQLEEANRQLATLSITDSLTGLANRRHFDDILRAECARAGRAGHPFAVIMLDVDYFKRYNDHYGHQAGDGCLVQVAHALAGATRRASDLAARYGGEEFSVVLPNTDALEAGRIGEALRAAVAALAIPHATADAGQVTISVGVAAQAAGAFDPDALMRLADAALYRAKGAGRNCVVVSTEQR